MPVKSSPQLSWISALSWIVGSVLVFSVISHKTIKYGFSKKRKKTEIQNVNYIVQTGPYKEAVHSDYLVEILDLSIDRPMPFVLFDVNIAEKKLQSSPVIRESHVKKIKPNMVYVDYSLRKPVVWAGDFVNTAMDKEGFLFPMYPFFSPKKLPEFYLGDQGIKESTVTSLRNPLSGRYLDVAFTILELLSKVGKDLFFIKKIDVSKAFAPTLGKREIVVVLENEVFVQGEKKPAFLTHFLRLSLRNFTKEISNYLNLREHLLEVDKQGRGFEEGMIIKEKVIDLRISQLAFIE